MNKETTEIQRVDPVITPIQLISQAIENGVDMDMLERLMALKERFDKQEAEKAFNHAFSQFQANKPEIIKSSKVDYETKTGGRTKYNFATLAKIQKLVDPVLSQFGLSYTWKQEENGDKIKMTCIVKHEKGHHEETYLSAGNDTSGSKNAIQAMGSSVSYLKRYTLCNALGLSADEDDDGEKSELTKEEIQDLQKTKLVELRAELEESLTDNDKANLDRIIKSNEVKSYGKAITLLKGKQEELKKAKLKESLKPKAQS